MFSITAPFWLTRISPFLGVRCDPGLTPVLAASGQPAADAVWADDEDDEDDGEGDAEEECEAECEGEELEDEEGEDADDEEETARPEALGDAVVAIVGD
ncbi:hypothetical protein ABH920_006871 [Catenulispora sp. EB89]|uniref:hypothetical protein n=1 Tax=Catenulispora sp. EB89 TaxID=3156257 RepID=UPI003512C2E2